MAGQVVVDALQHDRAAVAVGGGGDFVAGHPDGAQDALVQRLVELAPGLAAEGEAQVGHIGPARLGVVARHVHAHQRARNELVRGFLQRLAHHRLLERLVRVEVAGRLVQLDAFAGLFLDQQETAIAFDDRGHGNRWFEDIAHACP